jgi:hypothetical protein
MMDHAREVLVVSDDDVVEVILAPEAPSTRCSRIEDQATMAMAKLRARINYMMDNMPSLAEHSDKRSEKP